MSIVSLPLIYNEWWYKIIPLIKYNYNACNITEVQLYIYNLLKRPRNEYNTKMTQSDFVYYS